MADWNAVLGNAGSGAATGAAIGGPAGAVVGGALGGLTSLFGGEEEDPTEAWRRQVEAAGKQYVGSQTAALDPYKQLTDVAASKDALAAYRRELESYDPAAYATSGGGQLEYIDPSQNWEKFLDPAMALAMENATANVQESAAGRGGLYSGAAQNEIAKTASDTAMSYAKNAMDMAASEGQKQTNTQAQNWDQILQQNQANRAGANQLAQNLGTSYSATMAPLEAFTSGLSDINKTIYSGATGVANQGLQAGMAQQGQPNTWDQLANFAGTLNKSGVFR